ncbi:hypothetical protein GWI75_03320 [Proteus sp. G2660]|nr:hypothetical protein [Proteus sp. G2660]
MVKDSISKLEPALENRIAKHSSQTENLKELTGILATVIVLNESGLIDGIATTSGGGKGISSVTGSSKIDNAVKGDKGNSNKLENEQKNNSNTGNTNTVPNIDNSNSSALTGITQRQLDKKFKHAVDFGITTTKKNPETLHQYENAINNHMVDKATTPHGTYGFVKDSKVYFNSNTNNVVVLDNSGNFVTGFKLTPGTPQYDNYMKNGVLR